MVRYLHALLDLLFGFALPPPARWLTLSPPWCMCIALLLFGTRTDGKLYTFGRNDFGQLGLGDKVDRYTPTLVPGFDSVDLVGAGRDHVLFVNGAAGCVLQLCAM